MRFQSLVLLFLILLASAILNQAIPGGWSPIKNISDPYVVGIARSAVDLYDKQEGATLEFENLIKGESQDVKDKLQVVFQTNYRLTLSAKSGSSSNNYEAVVLDQFSEYLRNLSSFKRI
ncbi:cysteine proteinase inhibitor 1 [Lathyrus oleraceus]|uniref:cysteine proteinase inhibitor 1 n=1 Tax=Pisum sativum TaxID=3888 RepID=UPI0021D19C6A|nr:cysteine proteinase inhibitor 1-like [Pisum sativum]